ncbi:MAG: hypothetical protein HYZ34_15250 [Ignavibacteriae bacterium]|nr:hypothetical protein [Ignavibacteriota bacterium]
MVEHTTTNHENAPIILAEEENPPLPEWITINERGKQSVVTGIAADCFFRAKEGRLIYAQEAFWEYVDGVWKQRKDHQTRRQIQNMIGRNLARKSTTEDIIYQVRNLALAPDEFEFDTNKWIINFKNGVLDVRNGNFGRHRREYYQTIRFPYNYDPKAIASNWLRVLSDYRFSQATLLRVQEWAGYCIVPETCLEKCLYLKGEGDNGKSLFLKIIARMLGNAVADIEVTQLFDRFKTAELQGKLANICTDINTGKIFDEQFKKVVSGEKLMAERKHKDPFEFTPFARFLFSANNYIPTKDRSHGFFRRFDILEFTRVFKAIEKDEHLMEKLLPELPGIFNWAYEGLQRLIKNNWKMTESPEMTQALEDFKAAANPVKQFVEECCGMDINSAVSTQIFRQRYVEWCKDNGYEVLAENRLGLEVKRLGFEKVRARQEGKLPYLYKGIYLK